jgi:5-methylcytosine-specific restriction endonuclease McrA
MKNQIYEDYTKILMKTFFKYSWLKNEKHNKKSHHRSLLFNYEISNDNNNLKQNKNNNINQYRIFPFEVKEKCWNDSPIISNRDPNRWRLDALGNPVMKALRGLQGIFSHEYDHIFPYSLGGTSTIDNCQILQTNINRKKGNQFYSNNILMGFKQTIPESLKKIGINCVDDRLMDIAEELVYGNINKC